jgi:hypothetical protein
VGSAAPSAAITGTQWSTSRQTRTRNRKLPSRPASLHSTSFSGGATNITYNLRASAPYFWSISSGSTTLPFDFDITAPLRSTMPCVKSLLKGSVIVTSPTSRSTLVKNRE